MRTDIRVLLPTLNIHVCEHSGRHTSPRYSILTLIKGKRHWPSGILDYLALFSDERWSREIESVRGKRHCNGCILLGGERSCAQMYLKVALGGASPNPTIGGNADSSP